MNCNYSLYICISTVKRLTFCNNGSHFRLHMKGEGCQSVTVFGLHQIPGISSQNFGNLAFFVTEFVGIPRNEKALLVLCWCQTGLAINSAVTIYLFLASYYNQWNIITMYIIIEVLCLYELYC